MNRIPVKSSNLKSVGYDEAEKILEVEFLSDKSVFQYSRVPRTTYEELITASSKGRYFRSYIRDNQLFGCRQVFPIQRLLRV